VDHDSSTTDLLGASRHAAQGILEECFAKTGALLGLVNTQPGEEQN
jgi:hypothetical protein